jgi:hypothetical protein
MSNTRVAALAALALGGLLAAGAAQARDVQWSVTIGAPIGVYAEPAPVYYAPPPVYYRPAPVYVEPAPVYYYEPAPVYYRSAPAAVYIGSGWHGHGHGHRHGHRDWRR